MIILAIETAIMNRGSVALLNGEKIIEEEYERGNDYRDKLWPAIDRVLRKSRMPLEKIEAIAVSQGPGSFTGLRVGIAVSKTLALSLGKPLVGVPTLEILAWGLAVRFKGRQDLLIPILDAKKNLVYAAMFRRQNPVRSNPPSVVADAPPNFVAGISNGVKRETDNLVLTIEEICHKIKEPAVFLGEGLRVCQKNIKQELGHLAYFAPEKFSFPRASILVRLGEKKIKFKKADNIHQLQPIYLRRPEISKAKEINHRVHREKEN